MAYAHFQLPAAGGEQENRLNRFIAAHLVLRVERSFVPAGPDSFWADSVQDEGAAVQAESKTTDQPFWSRCVRREIHLFERLLLRIRSIAFPCHFSTVAVNESMISARAIFRDGAVVLNDPVDWNDGVELEVRPAGKSSSPLPPGGAKPGGELLAYLDHLCLNEPGCFLSEEALDRLSLHQEVPPDSPSHWTDEDEVLGG